MVINYFRFQPFPVWFLAEKKMEQTVPLLRALQKSVILGGCISWVQGQGRCEQWLNWVCLWGQLQRFIPLCFCTGPWKQQQCDEQLWGLQAIHRGHGGQADSNESSFPGWFHAWTPFLPWKCSGPVISGKLRVVVVAVSLAAHSAWQCQLVELGTGWTEHICTNLPNLVYFLLPLCSFFLSGLCIRAWFFAAVG